MTTTYQIQLVSSETDNDPDDSPTSTVEKNPVGTTSHSHPMYRYTIVDPRLQIQPLPLPTTYVSTIYGFPNEDTNDSETGNTIPGRPGVLDHPLNEYQQQGIIDPSRRFELEGSHTKTPSPNTLHMIAVLPNGTPLYSCQLVRCSISSPLSSLNTVSAFPTQSLYNILYDSFPISTQAAIGFWEPSRLVGNQSFMRNAVSETDELGKLQYRLARELIALSLGDIMRHVGSSAWILNYKDESAGRFVKESAGVNLNGIHCLPTKEAYESPFRPYFSRYSDKLKVLIGDVTDIIDGFIELSQYNIRHHLNDYLKK